MKLSIIIVNYNVRFFLEQCLLSVEKALLRAKLFPSSTDSQAEKKAEVIVVDNHSEDGSVDYIRQRFQWVRCISSVHNLGFSRANNLAIRQSKGEYVLLLNPDTVVGESSLIDVLRFMDSHPKAGAAGVRMLNADGTKALESRRGLPSPMVSFYKMAGLCKRYPDHPRFGHYYMGGITWDAPARIEVISGAFFLLRRKALDAVGLLDEDFFMYGEDVDLSYRLLKGGYENWYVPTSIVHYKGESTQKSSFRYVHIFYDAMLIFFRKHYSGMSFLLSVPIKSAIYMKAFVSLIKMLADRTSHSLGFTEISREAFPNYFFIGSKGMLAECERIALRYGVSATYIAADNNDAAAQHQLIIDNIDSRQRNYIVYDTATFDYEEIFSLFSQQPTANVFIGTYHPQSQCIITPKETLN